MVPEHLPSRLTHMPLQSHRGLSTWSDSLSQGSKGASQLVTAAAGEVGLPRGSGLKWHRVC